MTTPIAQGTRQPAASASAQPAAAGPSADFNLFLKLLTTQMQNQDPLNPMDSTQYTQQLAQYSQVEQSTQQTSLLRDILSRLSTSDMAQASTFIGRQAAFDTNVAGLGSKSAEWSYQLPHSAATITATIKDSTGRVMMTKELDPSRSTGSFAWDGSLVTGGVAPHGAYSLSLEAKDVSGNSIPATVQSIGVVDSVTSSSGDVLLGVNGAQISLSKLISLTASI